MTNQERPYLTTYPLEHGTYGTGTRIRNYPIPKRGDLFWFHPQSHFLLVDHEYSKPRQQRTWIYTGKDIRNSDIERLRFIHTSSGSENHERIHYITIDLWEEMGRDFLQPKKRLPYNVRCAINNIPREHQELDELRKLPLRINDDCKRRIATFLVSPFSYRSKTVQWDMEIPIHATHMT